MTINFPQPWAQRVEIGPHVLYQGDCTAILPVLSGVDAVVTDPPYGIGFDYRTHDDSPDKWFDLMNRVVPMCRAVAPFVIMPCCVIGRLPWWYANHQPDWVVAWYKGSPGHRSAIGFNDWEPRLVWGRPKKPMHDYFQTPCGFDDNGHPCPKPEGYARWLVSRAAGAGETVADPFMGSGTTGVACVKEGRRFIGIEMDPAYFDIARRRIEKAFNQPDLFVPAPPAPVQEALL